MGVITVDLGVKWRRVRTVEVERVESKAALAVMPSALASILPSRETGIHLFAGG